MSDYIMPEVVRNSLMEFLAAEAMHGRAPLSVTTPVWDALRALQPIPDPQPQDCDHAPDR